MSHDSVHRPPNPITSWGMEPHRNTGITIRTVARQRLSQNAAVQPMRFSRCVIFYFIFLTRIIIKMIVDYIQNLRWVYTDASVTDVIIIKRILGRLLTIQTYPGYTHTDASVTDGGRLFSHRNSGHRSCRKRSTQLHDVKKMCK